MNKWILVAASSVLMMSAHAKDKMWCDYKDYFHVNDLSHSGIHIVNSSNDQDVILQMLGPRSFIVKDSYFCQTGYARVAVAYDDKNWCDLTIKDGPYMNHPVVTASCTGMHYINTTYDGFNSYSYSINLD